MKNYIYTLFVIILLLSYNIMQGQQAKPITSTNYNPNPSPHLTPVVTPADKTDSIKPLGRYLFSFYLNYGYYAYRDNDAVTMSKLLSKKGASGYGCGMSFVRYIDHRNIALGGSAEINYLPANNQYEKYNIESIHYEDLENFDSYINNYKVTDNEIPISLNAKAVFYPDNKIAPFIEIGICYKYISFSEQGVYNLVTPYDNPYALTFDHDFKTGSFCIKPTFGLNFNASKKVNLFGKISYVSTKYNLLEQAYPHQNVIITNEGNNNQAFNSYVLVFPKGFYQGWLLSFGLSYNLEMK